MYEKQNFVDGQKLRAYQLNHMEEGIEKASNGFVSLEQTVESEEDGGENIITATRADGSTETIVIRNGRGGGKGEPGENGAPASPILVDVTTGKTYEIYIDNAKLMFKEVSE